jgi:hypothetical protein
MKERPVANLKNPRVPKAIEVDPDQQAQGGLSGRVHVDIGSNPLRIKMRNIQKERIIPRRLCERTPSSTNAMSESASRGHDAAGVATKLGCFYIAAARSVGLDWSARGRVRLDTIRLLPRNKLVIRDACPLRRLNVPTRRTTA